jgi:hypothetical protein
MKRPVRISLVAALVAACALSTASPHVHAAAIDDGMPDQSSLDSAPNSQSQGNWSDLSGGASGRPYVASLSVTTNGVTTSNCDQWNRNNSCPNRFRVSHCCCGSVQLMQNRKYK